jgi:rare lipoprotein A
VRDWATAPDDTDDGGAGPSDAYLGPMHTVGAMQIGTAAWYDWVGSRTASGEILDSMTATAAHRSLPLASYARVTNLDTGRAVIVKINDRGPWSRRFIIDLSPRAAQAVGIIRSGIAAVIVEPVAFGPTPTVAAYEAAGSAAMQ